MNSIEAMAEMLRYRRPHRSKTERKFIHRFISTLGDMKHDRFGNRYTRIGTAPIMYSCHTDSVHRMSGLQDIAVREATFKLSSKSGSNCLGADNGAGVWLMREMILAKKPGLYIFHRGEECGGLGSSFVSKHTPELVKDIKIAMAFDRRGTKSIITHQWGGRCCSDTFAESLGNELKLRHYKDQGGTFTDTANYTDLIPECTNVSVGFQSEHTTRETLDMAYLMELKDSVMQMDWEKLVIARKAGEVEPRTYDFGYYYTGTGKRPRWKWDNEIHGWTRWDEETRLWVPEDRSPKKGSYTYNKTASTLTYTPKPAGFLEHKPIREQSDFLPDGHEIDNSAVWDRKAAEDADFMLRMVRTSPALIVKLLEDYGIDVNTLADFVSENGGYVPQELYGDRGI